MPTPLQKAAEQLDQAVYYLAIGQDEIRGRLRLAGPELLRVPTTDLDPEIKEDFEAVIHDLTWKGVRDGCESPLASTLFGMRKAKAMEIAKRIWALRRLARELAYGDS
ncbi:MAG: hypothetical protein WBQ26_03695 [Gemmatimonadaceae bacterium]